MVGVPLIGANLYGVEGAKPPDGVRGVPEKPLFLFSLAASGGEKKKICSGDTPETPAQGRLPLRTLLKPALEALARRIDAIGKVLLIEPADTKCSAKRRCRLAFQGRES